MTLFSRLFGYLRDVVIAVTFGASGGTDAFFVAFRIPNLFRRMFAEGAFSQAFVPVFSATREAEGEAAARALADRAAGALGLVLMAITAICILAAPLLIRLFAPGFEPGTPRHELAVEMLRIVFPYLLFISLTALAAGILNSHDRFAVPAFTPVLLNLSLIGAALWLAPRMAEPVTALAWGVLVAGLAQLALQLPALARIGMLPRPRLDLAHAGVRRIGRLMLPALFGSSVTQLNILVNTLIASFLVTGSISWLYYSDRFVELPLALFGVAIGTVILPRLSRQHSRAEGAGFATTLDWALRLTWLLAIPATVGLVVLARPILVTLIQYGAFDAHDARMAGYSLAAYALGIPGFMLVKVLAPGFYARQDTRTPVRIGIVAVAVNVLLDLAIVLPWYLGGWIAPHAGLALATALAAWTNAGLLQHRLRAQGVFRPQATTLGLMIRGLAAALAMGALLWWLAPPPGDWPAMHAPLRAAWLGGLIVAGAGAYALALLLLGVRPRHLRAL